ncbi:MAG: GTPase HflX [Parachlamydiales bacterium]
MEEMPDWKSFGDTPPRALLVGTYSAGKQAVCEEHLQELKALSDTYGLETITRLPLPLRSVDPTTYLGSGKVEALKEAIEEHTIDLVVLDFDVSPSQQRNLEKALKRTVLDRTEIILDVFAKHARTKEAHIQIDLAKVRYEFPRLKRLWTHLSRQRGGGLAVKGAGEKQIEIDRRLLEHKEARLLKQLEEVRKHRATQRSARQSSGTPIFAIVGYTNAGKSTLLNALTGSDVLVEDQLFATLDTTTRQFLLPNKQKVLLIDTVGFIRKLPHGLVAAFKSTLEEVTFADVLLHVIDASSPTAVEQSQETLAVLKELGASDKPTITLLNKADKGSGMALKLRTLYPKTVPISALEKSGFDHLAERMEEELAALRKELSLRIPQSDYALVSELLRTGEVLSQEYEENDILIRARVPAQLIHRVEHYVT